MRHQPSKKLTSNQKKRKELDVLEYDCQQAIESNQSYNYVDSLIEQTNLKLDEYRVIMSDSHINRLEDKLVCFSGRNSKRDENGKIISLNSITQELEKKFNDCYFAFEKTKKEESENVMDDFRGKIFELHNYLSDNSQVLAPFQKEIYTRRVEDFYNWFLAFLPQSIMDARKGNLFSLYSKD